MIMEELLNNGGYHMHKFKIFERPKEKVTCYFKLDYNVSNNISLIAVEEDGNKISTILTISDDGIIKIHKNVNDRLCLKLDAVGRVKTVKS